MSQPLPFTPERPLSAEQACEWLGGVIDPKQLIRSAREGKVAVHRLPHEGAYLFMRADLLEWVVGHRLKDHPQPTPRRSTRQRATEPV